MKSITTDILVVGSGIAGLNFALEASEYGDVAVMTKSDFYDTNTFYAQGGIAAVLSSDDSVDSYIEDIMSTGDGLSRYESVKFIAENSNKVIERLSELGVKFDSSSSDDKKYDLGREGAHTHRRIVHVGTHTGETIEEALVTQARRRKNIKFLDHHYVIDLLISSKEERKVTGCLAYHNNSLICCFAKVVVLATGGLCSLYKYTVNPDISTGDGIAMGYRAGCNIRDLEFVQFHPTALNKGDSPYFLISEALRGEGAELITEDKKKLMEEYPRKGLESRDIVSREIFSYIERGKEVFLDITHKSEGWLKNRFSNIYEKCKEYGIDMNKAKIPITPAAHYSCGGIKVNIDGSTGIKGLFAIGELASTGVHGANRLASDSLLEAMVTSEESSKTVKQELKKRKLSNTTLEEIPIYQLNREEVNRICNISKIIEEEMWEHVGIIRSIPGLKKGLKNIRRSKEKIKSIARKGFNLQISKIENRMLVSELIIKSAIIRKESRGCHYLKDYPGKSNSPEHTILQKNQRDISP